MAARYCNLTDYVCVEAHGGDATEFLNGQLSQALMPLDAEHTALAAWHDARGRVRALVRLHRLPDRWYLITPRAGVEGFLKKLGMFVLRADVTLGIRSDLALGAILGATHDWLISRHLPAEARPSETITSGELRFTRIGSDYWQVLGPSAALATLAESLPSAGRDEPALAEIRLGLPLVTPALSERCVAQMLNLDLLGAVAYDKGCYPGQEIIARVHNLGGVKRRLRRYAVAREPVPVGTSIMANGLPVGEVLRSAATAQASELLALIDNAAAGGGLSAGNTTLEELPLPFPVPSD